VQNFANAVATRDILLRLTLQPYLPLKYRISTNVDPIRDFKSTFRKRNSLNYDLMMYNE